MPAYLCSSFAYILLDRLQIEVLISSTVREHKKRPYSHSRQDLIRNMRTSHWHISGDHLFNRKSELGPDIFKIHFFAVSPLCPILTHFCSSNSNLEYSTTPRSVLPIGSILHYHHNPAQEKTLENWYFYRELWQMSTIKLSHTFETFSYPCAQMFKIFTAQ